MTQVLKATEAQYNAINGYTQGNNKIEFIQDANDNWIIGKSVLTDIAFSEILPQLQELEEIPFNPKRVEI